MNSKEIIQKLNQHKENIGIDKATFQEGVLFGYGLALEEINKDLLLSYQKGTEDIKKDYKSRACENCKHWNANKETTSKGYCEALGVHNIGGCGDYFERKDDEIYEDFK